MKLGSGRRTRSRADGRNAGPGHLRRATRGLRRPIFSVQSVRPKEKARGSSCPHATARPWPCILQKSRSRSRQARMPSFSSIRRDGISRRSFPSRTTSRSCLFRRNRPSSIRSRTSGNSCATIGSQTASSNLTKTFWITAALPGTSLSTCLGKSCLSVSAIGPIGHNQ